MNKFYVFFSFYKSLFTFSNYYFHFQSQNSNLHNLKSYYQHIHTSKYAHAFIYLFLKAIHLIKQLSCIRLETEIEKRIQCNNLNIYNKSPILCRNYEFLSILYIYIYIFILFYIFSTFFPSVLHSVSK